MASRLSLILCAVLAAAGAAGAQPAQNRLFVELGGAGASVSINYERAVGPVFAVRAGLGTLSFAGVDVAVPLTARLTVGTNALALEAGAGVLVAAVTTEHIFAITTDIPEKRSVRAFPAAEMALRIGLGRVLFVRLGGAVLLKADENRRSGLLLPSLGIGLGL